MTQDERQNFFKGMAFLSPWIVGFAVFTAIPIGLSLYYSFCDYSLTVERRAPLWIGLDNYRQLIHDTLFWKSLANTLYYAAMALPAGLLVSLGLALMLNANIRGQSVYRTIIFLPSLVPAIASAMVWLWMYNTQFGLFNYLLGKLHLPPVGWLGERMAMPSLALMSVWGVGNTVIIYLAGLQDVPRELLEAAEIDGAGPWRRMFSVTLPFLTPVIFFNLVMGIIGTFSVFTVPYIMTQGGPNNATYFFTYFNYDEAFKFLHMGYASAIAWIQLVITLALTAIAFWTAKKWVHYG
ncbi:MAG TPA: sugar ABC transporter permease [Tepidisphaeraceae bacterium]|jgi:multiple sugar transport system permease protein|nr:sugar ABC transporter permease [Tepidisphaeraceae bacterium]